MIRFIVGMILVFGGVGAIEVNAAMAPGLAVTALGFALMFWSLHKFKINAGL